MVARAAEEAVEGAAAQSADVAADVATWLHDACWMHAADFVVFDTETTGCARHDAVVQMCYVAYDADGAELHRYDAYWRPPPGVSMDPRARQVHGIDDARLETEGREPRAEVARVAAVFATLRAAGVRMVAHNASFDDRMLRQTAERVGVAWPFRPTDFFCTQARGRAPAGLRTQDGRRSKAPSNLELYMCFHDAPPVAVLHDALADCRVTAASYRGGRARGWW